MLNLGDKILDNLKEDHIKKYFLDRDFKNRTVLRVIAENKFYPLLSSEKVNRLIQEIWVGAKTYECDGRLSDLSQLSDFANSSLSLLPGKTLALRDIFDITFTPKLTGESFWFQFDNRRHSVQQIYFKELFCALMTVTLF